MRRLDAFCGALRDGVGVAEAGVAEAASGAAVSGDRAGTGGRLGRRSRPVVRGAEEVSAREGEGVRGGALASEVIMIIPAGLMIDVRKRRGAAASDA
jgi:hypothetical protein